MSKPASWPLAGASAAFATVPGVAAFIGFLVPPEPPHPVLFAASSELLGVSALLILWLNAGKLRRVAKKVITEWAKRLVVIGAALLLAYTAMTLHCVVSSGGRTVTFPIRAFGELGWMIDKCGGREPALERYGEGGVIQARGKDAGIYNFTIVLLLLAFVALSTAFTALLGMLSFAGGAQLPGPAPPPKGAAGAEQSNDDDS